MRITKPGLSASLHGILPGRSNIPSRGEARIDEIRQCMLDCLGEDGLARFPAVVRRVRWTAQASDLWYLRSMLMAALCELHGERTARRQMATISHLFEGLLPGGLASRPSPLER
ncbi:MAG: hypothetical protein EOO25_06335 [Comamonadaceae bacterium]|nr:MAG: hypothetical protein EOO25_06335 [Comamonadaceae bacterium]